MWSLFALPLLAVGAAYAPLISLSFAMLFGWLGYRRARARHRSAVKWVFFCTFFGLIAYAILLFISRHDLDDERRSQGLSGHTRAGCTDRPRHSFATMTE